MKWLLKYPYAALLLIGAVLFLPYLGGVPLFDWDEINFAESAREMLVTGNYSRVMIDFQPFWEKPPLFFWLQAIAMHLFGVGEFAARLPNALTGIATLLIIFQLGSRYFDPTFAWWWVLIYIGSFLPHFYFKSGIIDPVFNLFVFLTVIQLFHLSNHQGRGIMHSALGGLMLGLAILTKGPVALLIVGLCWAIFAILRRKLFFIPVPFLFIALFVAFLSSFVWYGLELIHNGPWFFREFIAYHIRLFTTGDSGHGQPFYYHFLVLFIGCFPASLLLFFARKKEGFTEEQVALRLWMLLLLLVVLIVFSIAKTKIVHYSSLCYLPLTFLAALGIRNYGQQPAKWLYRLTVTILIVLGLVVMALPIIMHYQSLWLDHVHSVYLQAILTMPVHWPLALGFIGFAYLIAIIMVWLQFYRAKTNPAWVGVFVANLFLVQAVLYAFLPKIEPYSQGPAIEFYKSLQGKDVYVNALGQKSYAQLFYSQKPQSAIESPLLKAYVAQRRKEGSEAPFIILEKDWHLYGTIDKTVFFCCKADKTGYYATLPQLKEIGRKGGFVFYKREP
ncbi:MAG: glycosyltransferase family 39 protein [Chitinophagales bacterium]|nr:glycosyltransferase family 39 protein [Chitinophagales bacterium]